MKLFSIIAVWGLLLGKAGEYLYPELLTAEMWWVQGIVILTAGLGLAFITRVAESKEDV